MGTGTGCSVPSETVKQKDTCVFRGKKEEPTQRSFNCGTRETLENSLEVVSFRKRRCRGLWASVRSPAPLGHPGSEASGLGQRRGGLPSGRFSSPDWLGRL